MAIVSKKVMFQVPEVLLDQIDYVAHMEGRSRTCLLLEASRDYVEKFRQSISPKVREEVEKRLLVETPGNHEQPVAQHGTGRGKPKRLLD